MSEENVWDNGRWAGVQEVTVDFMTRYIFERMSSSFSFRGKRVLEMGCGTGRLGYLALKSGAQQVTLVDSSQKAVALAHGLFRHEAPGSYRICQADLFDFAEERYDLVFSSGVIEHFQGEDRYRIVKKHLDLSLAECLIVHPTDTLYAAVFNRLPIAVKLYGFQKSFSEEELSGYLERTGQAAHFEHSTFHPFYTVPLLHNREGINRCLDRLGKGRRVGGLTLTTVRLTRS